MKTIEQEIEDYYALPGNGAGGSLHVVLDDGNWEREHIEFCLQYAKEKGDAPGVALAKRLLALSDEELDVLAGQDDEAEDPPR